MADLSIQLLAVEGCPHLERARHDLEAVLRESIIETPIQLVLVGSPEDAEFLSFQGSPTIRVDGADIDPQPDLPVGLACRTYVGAAGERLGSPPVERIRAAVQAYRRGRLRSFQRDEAGRVAATALRAAADELGGDLPAVPAEGADAPDPGRRSR